MVNRNAAYHPPRPPNSEQSQRRRRMQALEGKTYVTYHDGKLLLARLKVGERMPTTVTGQTGDCLHLARRNMDAARISIRCDPSGLVVRWGSKVERDLSSYIGIRTPGTISPVSVEECSLRES